MKIVVVLLILCILGALGSALYQLMRHKGASDKTVKALTIRVALSIFLFLMLLLAHQFGLINPHNVNDWTH
jgi:peptidoglycan biosynthesis protein MviN/MurJ (putative lipid II flippase)